jgi:predicted transcriptional regulator
MVAEGKDLNAFLKEIPLKPIISCKYDTPLPDIIKKMKRTHEYKILITDDKGNNMGVLTEGDTLGRISRNNN